MWPSRLRSCCSEDAERISAPRNERPKPGRPHGLPGFFILVGRTMLFPTFLKLEGRHVLLVGGGPVAAGKLRGLLEAGAIVKVVAPTILLEIASAPVETALRPFEAADLTGVSFVVAAAPPEVN